MSQKIESENQRFWSKVKKTESCWNWIGCILKNGYGQIQFEGKIQYAHRVSYKIHKGAITDNLELDHLCRNRSCVNPGHLEAVTCKENISRGNTGKNNIHSKQTHCIRGHILSGDNLYVNPASGSRQCRMCLKNYSVNYKKMKKRGNIDG